MVGSGEIGSDGGCQEVQRWTLGVAVKEGINRAMASSESSAHADRPDAKAAWAIHDMGSERGAVSGERDQQTASETHAPMGCPMYGVPGGPRGGRGLVAWHVLVGVIHTGQAPRRSE